MQGEKYFHSRLWGIIMIEDFQEIMEKYLTESKKVWEGNEFAAKMRQDFKSDLGDFISSFYPNFEDNYKVSASKYNKWIFIPWYGILNNNITSSVQNGYFVVFLFKLDMTGFYLSLNLGAKEFNDNYENYKGATLNKAAENFREILKDQFDIDYVPMDLGTHPEGKFAKNQEDYQDGDVFSIFYSLEGGTTDEKLKNDIELLISMYEYLIEKRGNTIFTEEELAEISVPESFDDYDSVDEAIYDLLKNISDKYETEKSRTFRDNDFINEMKRKFDNYFDSYISDLVNPSYCGKFKTEIDFGFNDWIEYPEIKIYYDKLSTAGSRGLYINSLLNTVNNKLEFGLILDKNNFKNVSNESFINYLSNCIMEDNIKLIEPEYKLIINEVDFEVLDANLLKSEFENIIVKFEGLINNYICYVFEKEIKGAYNGPDYPDLNVNYSDLNNVLPDYFEISPNKVKELCSAFNSSNIILKGVPGTGKTLIAERLSSLGPELGFSDGYLLTTATSDWSTFDTMGGLMPSDDEKLIFKPGIFLEAISSNKWLIIDEINRADIDKAFGQLFTVLSGYDVELPYKDSQGHPIRIIRDEHSNKSYYDSISGSYVIGNNWRIIGTMNTVDKDTLYDFSFAFMRRFMFIDIDVPDYNEEFKQRWIDKYFEEEIGEYYYDNLTKLWEISSSREFGPAIYGDLLKYINERVKMDNIIIFDSEPVDINKIPNDNDMFLSIMASGINAYVIPQLEGLYGDDVKKVKDNIKVYFKAYYPNIDDDKLDDILNRLLNKTFDAL